MNIDPEAQLPMALAALGFYLFVTVWAGMFIWSRLAQQVFIEAWKSLARLGAAAAFNVWLRRIAVNVWLQHTRKKDTSLLQLTDSFDELPIVAIDPPAHGRNIDLAAALALLPAAVRLCIVLAYQEGMSHGDIATVSGIPLGTVKSHVRRGSARLRELLSDYEMQS